MGKNWDCSLLTVGYGWNNELIYYISGDPSLSEKGKIHGVCRSSPGIPVFSCEADLALLYDQLVDVRILEVFAGGGSNGGVVFVEKYVRVMGGPGIDIVEPEMIGLRQGLPEVGDDLILSHQYLLASHQGAVGEMEDNIIVQHVEPFLGAYDLHKTADKGKVGFLNLLFITTDRIGHKGFFCKESDGRGADF
jgi:hypothetical protein